jgi:hypothetical protein
VTGSSIAYNNVTRISASRDVLGSHMELPLRLLLLCAVLCGSGSSLAASHILRASEAGAHLDADLKNGGGTDDTTVLQRILDRGADGTPVELILDGPALVGGLDIYGNTIVECLNGAGLYLKNGSNRAILRNAHRTRGAVVDENITVRNCLLNGNREHQPTEFVRRPDVPELLIPSNKDSEGTYISGLQFLGVKHLIIEGNVVLNTCAFGILIANATDVNISDITINSSTDQATTDGLHFKGPIRNLSINNAKIRTGDDALAFDANDYETDDITTRNDYGPYVGQGPISDVSVSNLQLIDAVSGIRILSTNERIDRITISDVTGTVRGGSVVNISHWVNQSHFGNVGSIVIDNVNVDRYDYDQANLDALAEIYSHDKPLSDDFNGASMPFVTVNARVESLKIAGLVTTVSDSRPIIRLGPKGDVQSIQVGMSIRDVGLRSMPVQLDEGSHAGSLNLSLIWEGNLGDQGRSPIRSLGGTIDHLHWIGTPPMYVDGTISRHGVSVTFTERVKATDLKSGVTISINGQLARIVRASYPRGHEDVVQYSITRPIYPSDMVTWSYDATNGGIRNLSGDYMQSVTEKVLQHH